IAAATLAIGVLTAVGPVFIALFLIPATRGLFIGWLRALLAAALTPMLGWLTIVLMLSVLEPWLVALARQREAAQLDPQTAMSAAALVFVFGAGQAALLFAASTVAFGFRLGGRSPAERPEPAARNEPPAPAPEASRAQRLAFDLQRDLAQAETRWRPAQLAAALAAPGPAAHPPLTSERPQRLGDAYRRPAVSGRRPGARA
ncbi:MAG TPA: type IV secretion system protein, partial [Phenylobacterium sp.]